jgi:GDP-4-dehydro-6-deoxy-D-mannose reductase
VTGAAGFVGRHLTGRLLERGDAVFALVHPRERELEFAPGLQIRDADILDEDAIVDVVGESRPDRIFHLAAFSNPENSLRYERQTLETNIIGARNVLAASASTSTSTSLEQRPRVLLVGSGQAYGTVPESEQPIGEERALAPMTPYSVSKSSQELLGLSYAASQNVPVLLTRSFNHTGPGQTDAYVCSSFARQIAEAERGAREPTIQVGNLTARRDFMDVRDVVDAYITICDRGESGRVYNVCSGEAVEIRWILEQLIELASVPVSVEVDPKRMHAIDVPLIVGDPSRLRNELEFRPRFRLRETLSDLLDEWRHRR